ncbi:MAG: hypothetical protein ACRENE_17645 [Polyangiaceae bacterium]
MMRSILISLAAVTWACSKAPSSEAVAEHPDAGATATASLPADASARPTAESPSVGPSSWKGMYASAAGSVSLPDDLKVHWKPADTSSGLGEGPVSLTVDPALGVVRGTLGGPLGPARINGSLSDGGVSATIVRNDPNDHGYVGVLLAHMTPDHIDGNLDVSPGTAGAVRTATFTLSAAGGAAAP